jgi:hypothetical protein
MPRQQLRQWTRRFQPLIDRLTSHPTIRRFAPSLAALGWAAVRIGWRVYVVRAWRGRGQAA